MIWFALSGKIGKVPARWPTNALLAEKYAQGHRTTSFPFFGQFAREQRTRSLIQERRACVFMHITIVCVPYQVDITRWGCAQGPQAFLDHGLRQRLEARGHSVAEPVWIELPRAERTRDSVTNLGGIARRTAAAVREALQKEDGFALVLEGDCTHAVGAIGGLAQARGNPGVVWFDAHGDLHTMETTTSGFLGGMPYAVALGWDLEDWRQAAGLEPPVRPEAAVLVGGCDLDEAETVALQRHPILHIETSTMMRPDVAERVQAALRSRATATQAWHLHLDLDVPTRYATSCHQASVSTMRGRNR
jgi:arginase